MSIVPSTQMPIVVCALIPQETAILQILADLGCSPSVLSNGQVVGQLGEVTVLPVLHDRIEESVVLASDAVVLVIDGNLGVSPLVIDTWRNVSDWDIPRQISVVNSVTGRADFDEVVAICERVLEESLVVRYLPLENDDSTGVDGIYDILTSELHVRTHDGHTVRSAEPEHVALTAEKREVLIEDIAHAAMSDEQLANLANGMPISIPAVEQAWITSGLVNVAPIDDGISAHVFAGWFFNLEARWLPMVHGADDAFSVEDLPLALGIGIGKGVARVWNRDRAIVLERVHGKNSPVATDEFVVRSGLAFASSIRQGDAIRPAGTELTLTEPRF